MELIFNPCGVFQWSPEDPVSQIHSSHFHAGAPGIFSDLLRSVQMLKRVGCGKQREATATQEPRLQFNQGLNRYGSFPFHSAPHSLFIIWTDNRRSEKIPGVPTCRWEECISVTGPSGFQRNSTGVKYHFHQGFWPDQRSGNPNHPSSPNSLQCP